MGVVAAFLPVLWLFPRGPVQVYFGIVQYNLLYRRLDWPHAAGHNIEVLGSWIDSGHAIILILLAAGGLLFIYFRSEWEKPLKAEFYLCAWLSAVMAAYISSVLPTFERYYIFVVPFLAILAVAGLYAAGTSLYKQDKPWHPVLVLAFLLSYGLAKSLYEERDDRVWADLEMAAAKVNEVTGANQTLFADEAIYFLTRREPPTGMEMRNAHKFNFPPDRLALLHLLPQAELDREINAGAFSTIETCDDPDDVEAKGYDKLYAKSASAGECMVFWDGKIKR
jgi:hypothetical protein